VLEVKFESPLDPGLGLVLVPTRFGLEVAHFSPGPQLGHLDVPIGSLVHSVNGTLLSATPPPPAAAAVAAPGTTPGATTERGGRPGATSRASPEQAAVAVATEASFRALVAAVLPRPVKVGFVVDSEHKAVLQHRLRKVL
jgi:hypothetical protein